MLLKRGYIQTNTPWLMPSKETFAEIVENRFDFFEKYECYYFGGFFHNFNPRTKDIDLLIKWNGEDSIGDDCVDLCNYAHEKRQFLDITICVDNYIDVFNERSKFFNETQQWTWISDIDPTCVHKKFKPHDDIYINGEKQTKPAFYVSKHRNVWHHYSAADHSEIEYVAWKEKYLIRKFIPSANRLNATEYISNPF